MPAENHALGYAIAVLQAILYASMGIICKYLYGTGMTPEQVLVLRFTSTLVILGAFLLIWRKQPLFSKNPLVYVQGVFFMGSAVCFSLAVDQTTAGLATALLYAYPAVVALMSALVFREKITKRILLAIILALAGIFAISGLAPGDVEKLSIAGVLFGVGSCLSYAVCNVIGQKVVEAEGPLTITFSMTVVGFALLAVFMPTTFADLPGFTLEQYGWGAAMAVFATILPVVLLLVAIKIIGATKASLISTSETPFSILFAYLILGEVLTALQGAGCVLIVASIFAATLPSTKTILDIARKRQS